MKDLFYCTQNEGNCDTCSLVNYGRDCQNNPVHRIKTVEEIESAMEVKNGKKKMSLQMRRNYNC